MKGIKQTAILLLVLAAAVGGVASAQASGGQAPPANAAPNAPSQNMRTLQRQARELTLLNRLPEAARADAKALLNRAETLRQEMRQLQRDTLTAYVNELKKGEAPPVARELVRESVVSQRLRILEARVALRKDVQAFISKYPQAKALLQQFVGASRMTGGPHWAHGFPGMRSGPAAGFSHGMRRLAPPTPPAPSPQPAPQSGGA